MRTTTRLLTMALASLVMIGAAAQALLAQTVSLTSDLYVVSEAEYQPSVQIQLSAPATTMVTAAYGHQPQSAQHGFDKDYYVHAGHVIWQPGQSDPRPVDLFIIDDGTAEPTEEFTFFLTTVDGAVKGEPSTATIRIIDNDSAGPLGATIFDPIGTDFRNIFRAQQGALFRVGVRLSRIPDSAFGLKWQSELTEGVQTTIFDGIDETILAIRAPAQVSSYATFAMEILPDGLAPPGESDIRETQLTVAAPPSAWTSACAVCFYNYIMAWLFMEDCDGSCYHPDCPPAPSRTTKKASSIDVLQRYRDEILTGTAAGQFYIDLYDELSAELAWVVFEDLDILENLLAVQALWIPAFSALVDGNGGTYPIDANMQTELSQLFDALQAGASGKLAVALAFERDRLGLDSVAGKTMAELQARLETEGGVGSVPVSWGTMKARYGGD